MQNISRRGIIVSLLVAFGLLALLVFLVDWAEVTEQLRRADWRYLALGAACLLAGYAVFALRWRWLLRGETSFHLAFNASNVGFLVNTLIPMHPGIAVRILILSAQARLPVEGVATSFVVERWFEQILRLAAFGGALVFGLGMAISWATILGSVAFIVGALLVMVWMVRRREVVLRRWPAYLARLPRLTEERARRGLASLLDGLAGVSSARGLAVLFGWSLLTWSLFWAFHYLALVSLGLGLEQNRLLAWSLGSLAIAPPSAITLPGIYHVSIIAPLALLGNNRDSLTAYVVLLHIVQLICLVPLGAWGAARVGYSFRGMFRMEDSNA